MNTSSSGSRENKSRFRSIRRWLLILGAIALVFACAAFYFFQRFHTAADKVVLHSELRDQAVIVPFQLKNCLISFDAEFAGRRHDCILDTGCPLILWPRSENLPGKKTLSWGYSRDAIGNPAFITEVNLKNIKVRDYELRGVPTVAWGSSSYTSGAYPVLRQFYDLGNSAFSQIVLTIDYKKKILVLRNQHYDPMQHCTKHCFVLPFEWKSKIAGASNSGFLVITAKISGYPVEIMVDTGASSTCLTDTYYQTYFLKMKLKSAVTQLTGFGKTKAGWIPNLKVSVPDARPNAPDFVVNQAAVILPDQHDAADAIVGYSVLKDYRVTIDYPRRRIFLESP